MSFLASFRSEQVLSKLIAEPDPASENANKLIKKLKNSGNKAVPKIIDALALSDKSHTMVLVDILGILVNDKNLDMYREGLADGNDRVVSGTAWALSSSTSYNPNALLEFFDDEEVSKPALIEVLRVHTQDLSVHELLQRAYECEPKEKAAIFKIIEDTIEAEQVPNLIARMGGKDPVIKIHLMNLLTKFDNTEITNALEMQLTDPNKMVRGAALSALGTRGANVNVEKIASLLTDPDLDVQGKAVDVLIKAKHPKTVFHLVAALKDESEYARRAAVEVLNELGDETSVKDLLQAIKDDDWWVRSRAGDALAEIGGPMVVDSVVKLISEKDEDIRRTAIEILNTTKSDRAEDHLINATDDEDWWVRERAIDALTKIGSTKALPKLESMLGQDPKTDTVLVRALGKLGDHTYISKILPLLKRPERDLQVEAIKAISHLSNDSHAESIRTLLKKFKQSGDIIIINVADKALKELDARFSQTVLEENVRAGKIAENTRTMLVEAEVLNPEGRLLPGMFGQATIALTEPVTAATLPARAVRFDNDDLEKLLQEAKDQSAVAQIDGDGEIVPASAPASESAILDISTLNPGDVIDGRYKYIEKIGKGAFGTVLLMEDEVVDEQLILKFLNPNVSSDEEMMKRFVHELRYSRKITHRNIIRIYDFLHLQGCYALSMEYFPSHTLSGEIPDSNGDDRSASGRSNSPRPQAGKRTRQQRRSPQDRGLWRCRGSIER